MIIIFIIVINIFIISLRNYSRGLVRALLLGVERTGREELPDVLGIVRLLVGLEDRRPREGLAAECASEGSFSGVHATVVLHVMPQLERFTAELALEGSITSVDRQMRDERADVREGFAAELAEDDARSVGGELQFHRRRRLISGVRRFVAHGWTSRSSEVRVHQVERFRKSKGSVMLQLPVLERLQAVREDVPRQLALVWERGAAVHARIKTRRARISALHIRIVCVSWVV